MTNTAHDGGVVPRFEMRHRLALALEYSRVSISEMSGEIGIHRNTVGRYLSGQSTPNRAVMRVWALRTGVPLEWIQFGDSEPQGGIPDTGAHTLRYVGHLKFAATEDDLVAA